MIRILFILWDCVFVIAGWYLYRNPLLFRGVRHEDWQIRINKALGVLFMTGGGVVALAQVLFSFIRM